MSPTPGRSTLTTSAPNHASNCVQVGPDWTWVKSRIRTPFSALVIILLRIVSVPAGTNSDCPHVTELFFAKYTLRVEVADAAALGAGRRVDHRVDEGRLAGIHGLVDRAAEFVGRRRVHADATEC